MVVVLIPRREKEEDDDSNHHPWPSSIDNESVTSMAPPTSIYPEASKYTGAFPYTGPYTGRPGLPTTLLSQSPPESLQSSVSSDAHSPYSDNAGYSSTPTTALSDGSPQPTSTNSDDFKGVDPSQKGKDHSGHVGLYAAAGIVPVVVLAILGVAIFFYLRKRKRQRQQAAVVKTPRGQEMKARPQSTVQPFMAASPVQPSYTAPPSHPPPPASPTSPMSTQPVILGPIAPASNGAYYTGIDTSDIVSVDDRPENDRTGLGNPFADTSSLNEEPPPPYRPRSLAPSALSRDASVRTSIAHLSRDTSLRVPAAHSQTNLIERSERSPFADPDDDTVSEASGPTAGRHLDTLSIVSDLSYQEQPNTRSSV
ncbi:hypothetical protein BDV96DRAFT_595573 [Lophiotrema nucula]|uniref:Uncharacterized protein n=1 Tax=Lophiotrema nucula TaxID=690887 RepID=A0A6A5ZKT6_9PLEO|nr:hypothetical protein BDV96DRAFT_595573 [Lophiotrema nucula]